jgi:hypothetical protein
MKTLHELINQRPIAEEKTRREGNVTEWKPQYLSSENEPAAFQCRVFNFLLEQARELGIRKVFAFRNLVVDGAVDLVDGKRLIVEVKYKMNWLKACQAGWQFRAFLKRHNEPPAGPVRGGIVIFEKFSGDWSNHAETRSRQNGWNSWYMGHCDVDGFRLDLLKLTSQGLEACP